MSTRFPVSILVVALLAGCKPAPQADAPKESPAPASQVPADTSPAAAPADSTPPDQAPTAPAQPAPDAPPPTEPSPTTKPTAAASEPPLDSMSTATAPAKLSVPVDLKYRFDGDPVAGETVTLHLAAVPRIAGTHLSVSIKPVDGLRVVSSSKLAVQKANANDAYRQQLSITRPASVPELRVLVTMDMPEGLGHGYFSIPLESGKKSQKQDSVKLR
jgi:hypothetical protein